MLTWFTPSLLTALLALQKLSFEALQEHVSKRQELDRTTKEFCDGVWAASSKVSFAEQSTQMVVYAQQSSAQLTAVMHCVSSV